MSTLQLESIQEELEQAEIAQSAGNEGRARVCCRRAAGLAIAVYLQILNLPLPGPSAIERLKFLAQSQDTNSRIREISEHLLLRVNEEFELPIQVDLISETRWLIDELLPDFKFKE